jgi:AcrR family transcriptional regulator
MARQQRGEVRREQILEAAGRLFRSQGYAATSMRQIAAEAGFGRAVSGLYNHYAGKEAIFEALLIARSPYEELLQVLQTVDGATLETFLRAALGAVWPVITRHLDFVQLAFIDLQEFEGRTLGRFVQGLLPQFFAIFSRIQTLPDVRRDLPLPILIRTIAAAMVGYALTEIVAREVQPGQMPFTLARGEAGLDGFVTILARGLSAPEERHP